MSGIIQNGSLQHKAHLAGVEIDKVIAESAKDGAAKRVELRKKIADAKPAEKQAFIDELAKLEKGDADYLAGFRLGVNRGSLEKDANQETKDGYLAGMAAGKDASAQKPKSDIQATSPSPKPE